MTQNLKKKKDERDVQQPIEIEANSKEKQDY